MTTTSVYRYTLHDGRQVWWDVDEAERRLAVRVLTTISMDRAQMKHVADTYDYDRAHVNDVDPAIPGIAAPLLLPERLWQETGTDNTPSIGYILIDGIHRCVRAHRTGVPFPVRLLTDEDARACVLYADDPRVIP